MGQGGRKHCSQTAPCFSGGPERRGVCPWRLLLPLKEAVGGDA